MKIDSLSDPDLHNIQATIAHFLSVNTALNSTFLCC